MYGKLLGQAVPQNMFGLNVQIGTNHFIAEVVVRVCGYELTFTVSPKWPFKELQLLGSQHWPEVDVWCKALTMLYKFTSQL